MAHPSARSAEFACTKFNRQDHRRGQCRDLARAHTHKHTRTGTHTHARTVLHGCTSIVGPSLDGLRMQPCITRGWGESFSGAEAGGGRGGRARRAGWRRGGPRSLARGDRTATRPWSRLQGRGAWQCGAARRRRPRGAAARQRGAAPRALAARLLSFVAHARRAARGGRRLRPRARAGGVRFVIALGARGCRGGGGGIGTAGHE
jgi:hypothetical protein